MKNRSPAPLLAVIVSVLSIVISVSSMMNIRSLSTPSIPSIRIEFGDTFRRWDHEPRASQEKSPVKLNHFTETLTFQTGSNPAWCDSSGERDCGLYRDPTGKCDSMTVNDCVFYRL